MAIEEFRLPDVGEGVAEGEIVRWLVEPGDPVSEDQIVAEIETDKALVEIPSPYDGTVAELHAAEGEIVPVGDVIISFEIADEEGEAEAGTESIEPEDAKSDESEPTESDPTEPDSAESEPTESEPVERSASEGPTRTFASPSVRRLARELGVDLEAVSGSGPGGRLAEADVRRHAEEEPPRGEAEEGRPSPTSVSMEGRASAVTRRDAPESATDEGERTEMTEGASSSAAPQAADRDRTLAAPATRRLAAELDVDLNEVPTEGTRDGEAFVTVEQVEAYVATQEAASETASEGVSAEASEPADEAEMAATRPTESVPYRGVRRTIGTRMAESKFTAPHVTHHDTAEVSELVDARDRLKERAKDRNVKLTYMPFVLKAVVEGLKAYPELNAELREDDEEILLKKYYNVGIAVATDAGLMVPVVENVDGKGLYELAAEIRDLADRARSRDLDREEMQGGTFTVTNFGAIGGEYATPIINYPETAILGLGAIEKRPVVVEATAVDGLGWDADEEGGHEVVPRETLPLSLSIDHRVVDGAVAGQFVNTVMEYLKDPVLLLEAE